MALSFHLTVCPENWRFGTVETSLFFEDILLIFRVELAVGFRKVIFYVIFPKHVNNQANLKSPFKNHQQFGSVRPLDVCFRCVFFQSTYTSNRSQKSKWTKTAISDGFFHPPRPVKPTFQRSPRPRKVSSDPNSPTTVGSDHVGFGDFSCSSSEVGDQVFVGMPKRWFCAPIPCMVYEYLRTWMVGFLW